MSYENLARVYDVLTYDMPAADWAQYLLDLGENPSDILEYACGTGRITQSLVEAGSQVIAVDLSEQMLAEAADKLRSGGHPVRFVCADMTEFELQKPVKCAICACDGVNYLLTQDELKSFFQHAFSNLQPGGVFLFDLSTPYKLRDVLGNEFFYDDGDDQTLFWQNCFDEDAQVSQMDLTLFIRDDCVYSRFDEVHYQKAWESSVIQSMLEAAGFEQIQIYGFGTFEPPKPEDQRIQFCARKGDRI